MKILLFAAARQRVGASSVDLIVDAPITVGDLRAAFVASFPDMAGLVNSSRFAVDQKFVDDQAVVTGNEEIAFIPPVSGG